MERLYAYLAENPVTYVTRDRERAEGLTEPTPGYSIVADPTKSTRELAREFDNASNSSILTFKPSLQVEAICNERGWRLLNPSARLALQVESKVSQSKWLGELASLLPEHWTGVLSDMPRRDDAFVLQYETSHSGEGTLLIESPEQLAQITSKFPKRLVRASRFVLGTSYTNNNVVTREGTIMGNISLQRTGESELTSNRFATVGNDWGLASSNLTPEDRASYAAIAQAVGDKLRSSGWKGLFGLDLIREDATGKWYLIEINARQPASSGYESMLQRATGEQGLTIFEAHLAALLDLPLEGQQLIHITTGRRSVNRLSGKI